MKREQCTKREDQKSLTKREAWTNLYTRQCCSKPCKISMLLPDLKLYNLHRHDTHTTTRTQARPKWSGM